jgi:hypothetical protein
MAFCADEFVFPPVSFTRAGLRALGLLFFILLYGEAAPALSISVRSVRSSAWLGVMFQDVVRTDWG